jgi:vacuolar protein sorting-associated protein IST1
MAAHRISVSNNKRSNQVKHAKREIATLLGDHKDEKARVKVEHIIREDFMIESYELLGLMCELLYERIPQITMSKECPQEMLPAVTSIIWACDYVDFPELKEIASQLTKKFGDKFAKAAKANENKSINERLYSKLVYKPPSKQLVIAYLEEIARAYEVDWDAKSAGFEDSDDGLDEENDKGNNGGGGGGNNAEQPFATPTGYSIPMAPGSGLSQAYAPAYTHASQVIQ